MTKFVESFTRTALLGVHLLILKITEFPRILTDTSSPDIRGIPVRRPFRKLVNSPSIVVDVSVGNSVTSRADLVIALLTLTVPFSGTPTFLRVCPSIRMISGVFSSSSTGHTMAQLEREPVISTISPEATCKESIATGPIRARRFPTSRCIASLTRICIWRVSRVIISYLQTYGSY